MTMIKLLELKNCEYTFEFKRNFLKINNLIILRYAIGCRNYYVRKYSDAADDLSEASKLFGEVYGIDAVELGDVYLMYAKSLIAIGQEENKLIDVPEEEEDDEEGENVESNGTVPEDEGFYSIFIKVMGFSAHFLFFNIFRSYSNR